MLRKTNFLSVSLRFSEIVTFGLKSGHLYEFPPKCIKTIEKHSFAVFGSFLGEKQVFVNISLILLICSKKFVYTNPNLHQDFTPFQTVKTKTFLSISVLFMR